MMSPSSRRRPFARTPKVSDDDVLDQLRRSLEALLRANRALEQVERILIDEQKHSSAASL